MALAQRLDEFASALEAGDSDAADQVLQANPELTERMGDLIESLRMLCRSRSVGKPAPHARRRAAVMPGASGMPGSDEISQGDFDPEIERESDADVRPMFDPSTHDSGLSTLGDYHLHREIGRGGMGIVYEATQLSLCRHVAVKVLPFASVLDQQQIARFRNEAQAAASLHHPHIVPVFGVGCERGVHYFSMQLINGQSLEQTLASFPSGETDPDLSRRLSEMRRANADQTTGNTTTYPPTDRDDLASDSGCSSPLPESLLGNRSTRVAFRDTDSTVRSKPDRHFIRDNVELIIHVADALEYAHGQGVIHRDIKPSNLLVDGSGKVWVADFGLARCRDVGDLTAEGSLMGTIRYMSPEQIAGRSAAVDHRTDIYSLGVTLYELLTLRPAFQGSHRATLMRAVETENPTLPRRLNPAIAVDLETILLKAIAKSKDDRYPTAGAFADDLRRFLDGRPTTARRPTMVDRAFKWAMRRRAMVLMSILALVSVIVVLAVSTVMVLQRGVEKDRATQQARHHLNQAHAAVDRFGGLTADRLAGMPGADELRHALLAEAERYYLDFVRYAEDHPGLQRELATIQYRLGAVQSRMGNVTDAEQSYQQAIGRFENLRARRDTGPQTQTDLAICLHNLAMLLKDRGQYADAEMMYRRAIVEHEQAIGAAKAPAKLILHWAATQTNLAALVTESGSVVEATEILDQTLDQLDQLALARPAWTPALGQRVETRNALVAILLESDLPRAESLLRKSIAELERQKDSERTDDSPAHDLSLPKACQLAVARNNLATLVGRKGDPDEAIALAHQAVAALDRSSSQSPSDTSIRQQLAIALNNHGQLLWSDGQGDPAMDSFERAEREFRKVVAARPELPQPLSRLAGVLHNLSVVDQQQGDLENAVTRLVEAMDIQSMAIKKAPFHRSYRQYLTFHRELLDQTLHQLNQDMLHSQASLAPFVTPIPHEMDPDAAPTELPYDIP